MSSILSAEDRERLETLFDRASELPRAEHAAFVARECRSNDGLRDELARLLAGLVGEDILGDLAPGAPLRAGTRFGPYQIVERIGEGGMGDVYAADQLAPVVRRVALKVIKPGMDSAQVVARFEAERQVLAVLAHPNIAQVLDGGATADGRLYFVMELVPGVPITEYCDRRTLATTQRLELFLAVCDGVQHAHVKGIIHRDLKPSNLLVMEIDGHAIPKIIDFGVARATGGRLAGSTMHTLAGQIIGTLDYMSPEQADPEVTDVDTRTDVYALGVVLYQLLSGLLPFEHRATVGEFFSEKQRALREKGAPTPSIRLRRDTDTRTATAQSRGTSERALIRQLAGDLDWICLKALEANPRRRYQSAAELAQDLRRHLADKPVLAHRPGTLYVARKFVRRHRVGVAAGVLVAGAAFVGVVGIVKSRGETRAQLAKVLRLSDGRRLQELENEANQLWPAHPETVARMVSWLSRAHGLAANLADHRETLAKLRVVDKESRWWHEQLSRLVTAFEKLDSPLAEPPDALNAWQTAAGEKPPAAAFVPPEPTFAAMERRIDHAAWVEQVSLKDHAGEWNAAIDRIAKNPKYGVPQDGGMRLKPQCGLVPLGPDPLSGLEEFWNVETGARPERDPKKGRYNVEDATGLVFVLLPGGTFWMGAQRTDPAAANYDPKAETDESPVHDVELAPCFLSKFEMTQAQWLRVNGSNPGKFQVNTPFPLTSPVETISWNDSTELAARIGLRLPTEAEWEYAARGGTTSVWWSGDDAASISPARRYAGNVLDQRGDGGDPTAERENWDDGCGELAPVGWFAPNGFGLHNVIGNVWEWCADEYVGYATAPASPGDSGRVCRGGGWNNEAAAARAAFREKHPPETRVYNLGLRPARAITK